MVYFIRVYCNKSWVLEFQSICLSWFPEQLYSSISITIISLCIFARCINKYPIGEIESFFQYSSMANWSFLVWFYCGTWVMKIWLRHTIAIHYDIVLDFYHCFWIINDLNDTLTISNSFIRTQFCVWRNSLHSFIICFLCISHSSWRNKFRDQVNKFFSFNDLALFVNLFFHSSNHLQ